MGKRPTTLLILAALSLGVPARAQLPTGRLNTVFPAGGQQGTSLKVRIVSGADLDETKVLWFSHPGIRAVPTTESIEGSSEFHVTIDPSVPSGLYEVRAGGIFGLSNPRLFMVGQLPEQSEVEPNNRQNGAQPVTVNATVNGQILSAGDVDWFRFSAKAGQRILIECHTRTLDSPLRPRVELFNEAGRRLEKSRGDDSQDAMIDATIGETGTFLVQVTDHAFRGSIESVYRLTVHTLPHIDFCLPSAVVAGKRQSIRVFGRNLRGGEPAGQTADGKVLQSVTAEVIAPAHSESLTATTLVSSTQSDTDGFTWRLGASNPVFLQFARRTPVAEVEPNDAAAECQQMAVPGEVAGQFQSANDVDLYEVNAKGGEVLYIEVLAHRAGSSADPYFVLESVTPNGKGQESTKRIVAQDDNPTNIGGNDFLTANSDPSYRFAVPADGKYRVSVRDRFADSRGSSELGYRLVVRKPKPDFRLIAIGGKTSGAENQPLRPGAVAVRQGGNYEATVVAHRRDGFADPIRVFAENLPPDVTCKPIWLGGKQHRGTLVFQADSKAAVGFREIRIRGESVLSTNGSPRSISRVARPATIVRERNGAASYSRLSRSLMLVVLPGVPAFQLTTRAYEINANQSQQVLVPLDVVKRNKFDQNVNITFLGQPPNLDVEAKPIAKGKTTESFRWLLKSNVEPGTYTVIPRGKVAVPFQRNPWKVAREEAAFKVVDARFNSATGSVEAAKAEVKSAETTIADLQKRVAAVDQMAKALVIELAKQKQAIVNAESAVKKSQVQLEMATKSLSARTDAEKALQLAAKAAPGDTDIAQKRSESEALVAVAEQTVARAKRQIEVDQGGLAEARKLADATVLKQKRVVENAADYAAKIKAGRAVLGQAMSQVAIAEKALKNEVAAKTAAAKRLQTIRDQNKFTNINVYEPSTPIILRIKASPLSMSATIPNNGLVKRGQVVHVKVKLTRGEYPGPVLVGLNVPSSVAGVSARAISVPATANDASLRIEVAPTAAVGSVAYPTVRAEFDHDGGKFIVDAPIKLQVQE